MYSETLLAEIKQLISDQEILWGYADIAKFLNLSKSTVQNRICPRPDFPKPYIFSEQRTKRWEPKEVKAWALKQR